MVVLLTVFASGFLTGDAPDFGLWVATADGTTFPLEQVFLDSAQVQIYHNVADTPVDIYLNGEILLDDFQYQDATPFVNVSAAETNTVAVAPSTSTSVEDAIASFELVLEADRAYTVVANGEIGSDSNPFGLVINDMAKTAATDPSTVEVNVFHGSATSPAVDVAAVDVGNLFENLSYTEFSAYGAVPPAAYTLQIKPTGTEDVVASFDADLSGLTGGAATVIAFGELGNDENPFSLNAVLPDGTVLPIMNTPLANVQVIHNAIAPTVDVYANGELLINDFEFRTATPFQMLPAGVDIDLAIAADTSTSAASAIANFTVNFVDGQEYVVVAGGALGDANFPFNLFVEDMARSQASDPSKVDFTVFHGSPGAPAVDVDARTVGNLISGLSFGSYSDYVSVDPATYYLDVLPSGIPTILTTLEAPLDDFAGQSLTVLASGFLLGEPSFAALAVDAAGNVIPLQSASVANVQVIHNAIAPTVDVYANGDLLIDNFEFRTATPFQLLPAGVDIDLAIAADTSTSAASAIANFTVNFTNGQEYLVVAGGALGDANFPFNLFVEDMARSQASDPSKVDFTVFHGSPGAPGVDVDARTVGNLISGLTFGNYSDYVSVDPATYYLDVLPSGIPTILTTLEAPLDDFGGQSLTVLASGFLLGEPSFAALAVDADGNVIPLMPASVANVQVIHNAIAPTVDVYANGDLLIDNFEFRTATPFQLLPAGVDIDLAIAADTSTSAASAIANFTVNFTNGQEYVVVAGGALGDANFPFNLFVEDMARSQASDPSKVDFTVFHGSPGAPGVDVNARTVGNLISGLTFGNYSDYVSVDPATYYLDVLPSGIPTILTTLEAPLDDFGGQSLTVLASGFLLGEPSFAALAVDADGNVIPLMPASVANVQVIHNAIAPTVDVYANGDLLIDNFEFRTATPFQLLPAGVDIDLAIAADTSTSAASAIANFTVNFTNGQEYVVVAGGALGDANFPFNLFVEDMARSQATDPSKVDLTVFHGSPGAPAVDVDAKLVGRIVPDLSFGNYSDYVSVDPATYYLDILPSGIPTILATYEAPLADFGGQSLTVLASGFLLGEPSFAALAVDADGNVIQLMPAAVATLQVIHNAVAPTVDIYAGADLFEDDFAFRTATEFRIVPAGVEIPIGVATDTSTTAASAIATFPVTFDANTNNIVFATGILGDDTTPFTLDAFDMGRVAAADGGVDLLLYHGSPDAPAVDVLTVGDPIFTNVAYGEFEGYVNVPGAQYTLDITPAGDNDNIVASYIANVTSLEGGAATVFASGLFSGEEPGFAVWVALADGTTFPLEFVVSTNELEGLLEEVTLAPNPANVQTRLTYELKESVQMNLGIFTTDGKLVRMTQLGNRASGIHTEDVDTVDLPAGQYYISLISSKGIVTKQLTVVK